MATIMEENHEGISGLFEGTHDFQLSEYKKQSSISSTLVPRLPHFIAQMSL